MKLEVIKSVATNSNGKRLPRKQKILYFTQLFIDYHVVIDNG